MSLAGAVAVSIAWPSEWFECGMSESDMDGALPYLNSLSKFQSYVDIISRRVQPRLRRPDIWAGLIALATELDEHKTLNLRQVQRLLDGHIKVRYPRGTGASADAIWKVTDPQRRPSLSNQEVA
jgi:hypothetical protein